MVGDADALIALISEADAHHQEADRIARQLDRYGIPVIFPVSTVAETINAFRRKFDSPLLAQSLTEKVTRQELLVETVDSPLLSSAIGIFNPHGSKKNTIFDAIVAALAREHDIEVIFAFDEWYEKLGFTLAKDIV